MRLFSLFFIALLTVIASSATAQSNETETQTLSFSETRVLFSATDRVKGNGGEMVTRATILTYDPIAGQYVETVRDGSGAVVSRKSTATAMVGPTPEEAAFALQHIKHDSVLRSLIGEARHEVVIEGGFPLVREPGHPCGPGSRCLQYDVMELVPGKRGARRIRYVIIDLRDGSIVDRDANPDTEGNLANPTQRTRSRRADSPVPDTQ